VSVFGFLVTVGVSYLRSNCTQHAIQLSESKDLYKTFYILLHREVNRPNKM